MKKIAFVFLSLVLLFSCSSEKTGTTSNNIISTDSLKKDFKTHYKGVWLITDYIKDIKKTKSPLKSADKLKDIVTLIIENNIVGDSIDIGLSLNNHEGGSFTTYFIQGNTKNSLKTNIVDYENDKNHYELGYEKNNGETFLFLYHYNYKNRLIDKVQYTKVLDNQSEYDDASFGLDYFVNKALISGKYTLIDSSGIIKDVFFEPDGSLQGFENYKKYYYCSDFVVGQTPEFDQLAFSVNRGSEGLFFGMVTKNDTLFLYSLTGDGIEFPLIMDKMVYKLIRK